MTRVLFVTNGHGETAIADRIALELHGLVPDARADHLALVGAAPTSEMHEVGPRRTMPSGGLIAMGNVRNLARDLRAGLLALSWNQMRFLRRVRGKYDAVVAVGDVYALGMALRARTPTVFVGSAKSVAVAPYGRFEAATLARAAACFVRDGPTAQALRRQGANAEAANAIVDLLASKSDVAIEPAIAGFTPVLGLFPGSRERAYGDAEFLLEVTHELAAARPGLGAALSVARGLNADRFARDARRAGWAVRAGTDELVPFVLSRGGREIVRGWRGPIGPLIERVALVLGQAGTANEAAAAGGVPVVAFERGSDRKAHWYRQRQQGLLGEAMAVLPRERNEAVAGVSAILDDPARQKRMGEIGRARMGEPGGTRRIAQRIATLLNGSRCDD
ncbi:MAG: hypothetical protein WBE77_06590 [Candidatus Cybelea sp.]